MTENHSTHAALYSSAQLRARRRAERRFQAYGAAALLIAASLLLLLLISIVSSAIGAFTTSRIMLDVPLDTDILSASDETFIRQAPLQLLVGRALKAQFPEVKDKTQLIKLYGLVSRSAALEIQKLLLADPSRIGSSVSLLLPLSSQADHFIRYHKAGKLSSLQQQWLQSLEAKGAIRTSLNWGFLTQSDSRDPVAAGIMGSFAGSLLTLAVCLLLCFPFGVAAAIYLEEIATKNRFTDSIEININNLAAVPSIIFGLLGLSVFLQLFGMPRSSALVGGATLSLLVLPTIIIATRNALKAVPPSIRDSARSLGATEIQVVLHHTLPLALPGIMTGTILSMARALGETAPLLMIGMVAFIADIPRAFSDPATTLPVQIYLWSDSPEAAFAEKTAGCILVLILLLAVLNFSAAMIRSRFEKRW